MSDPSSGEFFEQVSDALLGSVAPQYADFGGYSHGYGIKVTYGEGERTKEHYEAQIVRAGPKGGLVLEIGFHSEHSKADRNEEVLATLLAHDKRWRKALGKEPVAGPFLGNERWRRISETWSEFDFRDPDLPFEVSDRLAAYIAAFEPLLAR
ncbi:MAG TPA: hypothetical protein VGI86_07270 [Acidimicrobiia bacterium]